MPDATPVENEAESRFEIEIDGLLAELVYDRRDGRLVITHTEVPGELEGRGLGGELVAAAVGRAAENGLVVVPQCPFARAWLERHPDIAGRAEIDWSGATAPQGEA